MRPRPNPTAAGLLLTLLCSMAGTEAQVLEAAPPLTNASQIRSLTAAQAAQHQSVRLRGVMLSEAASLPGPTGGEDPTHSALVISDQTAAVYVLGQTEPFSNFHVGDLLEVDGVTDPGQFAPFVVVQKARRVGTAPVPEPLRVTYQQLVTGGLDAQWVELSGVVRSWEALDPRTGAWGMVLGVDGNKVAVTSNGPRPAQVEPDATVRIRCICFYQFNQQRQVMSPALLISREVTLEVEKPAPAEPFATAPRPVTSLLQFSPENVYGHRVHVRGTVTFQQPGQMLWIRDLSGAAGIEARQTDLLEPGDEVDVLGYPKYGSASVSLEDAIFQKRRAGQPPVPLVLHAPTEAFNHEADLVSLEAVLTGIEPILGGHAYTLQEGGKVFTAILKWLPAGHAPPTLRPGSRLLLTGICSTLRDESSFVLSGIWHPQSLQILLRSPDDLVVIQAPPWWTPWHLIVLLALITGTSLLATAIIVLLARLRMREQASRRKMAETEFAAILSERNRMAREIHDTLAQGLVAISVQLRLAQKHVHSASQALGQHLATAQQLVSGSLEEARASIWNMRSQVLENGDLASALEGILHQLSDGTGVRTSFDVLGRSRRLAPVIENNLLRVGQEAITNATKHAKATRIRVTLEFAENQFQLRVVDDGRGFDPAKPPPSEGGFGLVGMRERAAHLNGRLEVQSTPGEGAQVTLSIPLTEEAAEPQ